MFYYTTYRILGTVLYILLFPAALLSWKLPGKSSARMAQRFGLGLSCPARIREGAPRVWIHAASVGEVLAAGIVIQQIRQRGKECEFILSTMTSQGVAVAHRQLPAEVTIITAPLDIPLLVRRVLRVVRPDVYVCMETELWPGMFTELARSLIPSVILNARMTERSHERYLKIPGLMSSLLSRVSAIAAISEEDRKRFCRLGALPDTVTVTGNVKYDFPDVDTDRIRSDSRKRLEAGSNTVFVCGSTRTGEEEILAEVVRTVREKSNREILWVLAPRHLKRLEEVKQVLSRAGFDYDLFSKLKISGRTSRVVLVDTMGDLASLYSAGDLTFVGGSLVSKRGHNVMEAARWGLPVYFGPSTEDFSDAASLLEREGGGFRVEDGPELARLIISHLKDRNVYEQACRKADSVAGMQRGAASRQVNVLLEFLPETSN